MTSNAAATRTNTVWRSSRAVARRNRRHSMERRRGTDETVSEAIQSSDCSERPPEGQPIMTMPPSGLHKRFSIVLAALIALGCAEGDDGGRVDSPLPDGGGALGDTLEEAGLGRLFEAYRRIDIPPVD